MKPILLLIAALLANPAFGAIVFELIEGKTHYEILGVSPKATREEIKAAFRNLIKTGHPDHGGTKERAQQLSQAYSDLYNPDIRMDYDAWLGLKPSDNIKRENSMESEEASYLFRNLMKTAKDSVARYNVSPQFENPQFSVVLELVQLGASFSNQMPGSVLWKLMNDHVLASSSHDLERRKSELLVIVGGTIQYLTRRADVSWAYHDPDALDTLFDIQGAVEDMATNKQRPDLAAFAAQVKREYLNLDILKNKRPSRSRRKRPIGLSLENCGNTLGSPDLRIGSGPPK